MRRVIGWNWIVVWLGCLTVSAAQLPPEMLVDKYLLQATMLSEEKNHKGALEAMDQIVALQKEHDLRKTGDVVELLELPDGAILKCLGYGRKGSIPRRVTGRAANQGR